MVAALCRGGGEATVGITTALHGRAGFGPAECRLTSRFTLIDFTWSHMAKHGCSNSTAGWNGSPRFLVVHGTTITSRLGNEQASVVPTTMAGRRPACS